MWIFKGQNRPAFAIEPGEGQESVWDYPRPPACVEDSRQVEVRAGESILCQTQNAIRVLETASPPTFYLPIKDVNVELLERVGSSSFCEWKGMATYWRINPEFGGSAGLASEPIGWSYETPSAKFQSIKDHMSFYPALVACFVDSERVRPQSGGFYGGWVTSEIVGPYKGEPGTSGW